MSQAEPKKATLSGNDILFDCRHCGKNLVIDCRGAGLNIYCPQCKNELEVPIPEGFDLADLDKIITSNGTFNEDVKATAPAPHLAAAGSPDAAKQINALKAEIEALRARQQHFTQQHADMLEAVKTVTRQADEFRRALDELSRMLDAPTGPQADETQKLG